MNIQIKEMKLTFIVNGQSLTRIISDLSGNVIWQCITSEAADVDLTNDGLAAYEIQMKSLPCWNIVAVEKIINGTSTFS
jgi:hypothetical protein